MRRIIPPLYTQTSTVIIDDDILFSENLAELISPKGSAFAESPHALSALSAYEIILKENDELKKSGIDQIKNWNHVIELFKPETAHSVVSVIVIDHCMNPSTGIEICQKLNSPFTVKILASNFPDKTDFCRALNNGIVDFFFCKRDPNFFDSLQSAIEQAREIFFARLARFFPGYYSSENPLLEAKLADEFFQICQRYEASSYEADSTCRNIKFFDKSGKKRASLKLFLKEELDALIDGRDAESASRETIELINHGIAIPWFDGNLTPNGKLWHRYLNPARTILGKNHIIYGIKEHNNA